MNNTSSNPSTGHVYCASTQEIEEAGVRVKEGRGEEAWRGGEEDEGQRTGGRSTEGQEGRGRGEEEEIREADLVVHLHKAVWRELVRFIASVAVQPVWPKR